MTNAACVERWPRSLAKAVVGRILALADYDDEYSEPEDWMRHGLVDPYWVFVKQEPHSLKKFQTGRFRLIMGASLLDQTVDRILFGAQNEMEIENWKDIPSKPGMGFERDSAIALVESVKKNSLWCSTDASGWDWSVQGWELALECDCRIALMENADDWVKKVVRNRFKMISRGLFVFPDGELVRQDFEGMMKSGLYITSSSNSRMRFLAAFLVRMRCTGVLPPRLCAIAMGDDCLETWSEDLVNEYSRLGHTIKVAPFGVDSFEFCSHVFRADHREGEVFPVNPGKMLFNVLHGCRRDPVEIALLVEQFVRDLRDLPDRWIWLTAFLRYFKPRWRLDPT